MTFRRLLTGSAVLAALLALMALGIWQLQRKSWKEALIADIGSRAHGEPVALPSPPEWNAARDEFRHVAATGTFLHDREIRVYGLLDSGGGTLQGSYLFTPFALDGGGTVLVNRGFVPEGETAIIRPNGPIRIAGLLRAPEVRGWFVPENIPAKGQWHTRDNGAMADALGIRHAAPFYIEADREETGRWPRGGTTRSIAIRNDHLQYALTWFGLAFVLMGVAGHAALRR